ncbi:MAG: hypothetical protein R2825_29570 [Saprospiraceae bacterium]
MEQRFTTEDLTGVAPGTYTVLVTDAYLCIGTAQVTVGNNNVPINISGTTTANTTCSGNNGGVNISITPAGNYTINWSNGETSEDLTNVAGTYVVTVSSGGNCQSTATFTVQNQVEDPDISQTITAAICGEANCGHRPDHQRCYRTLLFFMVKWRNLRGSLWPVTG